MAHADQSPSGQEPSAQVRPTHYDSLDALKAEVADAKRLLDFAIANGKPIAPDLILALTSAEKWLTLAGPDLPDDGARVDFSVAYRNLAQALAPVSAATLKATSDAPGDGQASFLLSPRHPISVAKLWSRQLWVLTGLVASVILFSENTSAILDGFFPAETNPQGRALGWRIANVILESLEPFAYGALGALTFLLRTAHTYIYERTFNPLRMPEYYNRLLLGLISGGAIKLLISPTTADDNTMIELSASAMAFIAGYSSDVLFSAIERIIAAILPKSRAESANPVEPQKPAGQDG